MGIYRRCGAVVACSMRYNVCRKQPTLRIYKNKTKIQCRLIVALRTFLRYNIFMKFYGFSPVFDGNCTLLILGSFPGVKSRSTQFYYGNARNRFWATVAEAVGQPVPLTVPDKTALCLNYGIALWDIVASCRVDGSKDSSITDYTLVNIDEVASKCGLRAILCNGSTAYKLTLSAYKGNLPVLSMPSTSPANVRFDKSVWLNELRKYARLN